MKSFYNTIFICILSIILFNGCKKEKVCDDYHLVNDFSLLQLDAFLGNNTTDTVRLVKNGLVFNMATKGYELSPNQEILSLKKKDNCDSIIEFRRYHQTLEDKQHLKTMSLELWCKNPSGYGISINLDESEYTAKFDTFPEFKDTLTTTYAFYSNVQTIRMSQLNNLIVYIQKNVGVVKAIDKYAYTYERIP